MKTERMINFKRVFLGQKVPFFGAGHIYIKYLFQKVYSNIKNILLLQDIFNLIYHLSRNDQQL